jgi:polar amino acid transport system substrate-binding protein
MVHNDPYRSACLLQRSGAEAGGRPAGRSFVPGGRGRPRHRVVLLLPLLVAACDLPKDPEGTTERVLSTHVLRVGVTENPPWVRFRGEEVEGIEPDLIRAFAGELGAQVQWVRNGETPLLEALEKRELDIVAGGITSSSPWSSQLGMTQTYLRAKKLVAVPAGSAAPKSLKDVAVGVTPGDAAAERLRSEGARPIPTGGAAPGSQSPRVVYNWEVSARSLTASRFELGTEKHVLATVPGENQFLLRLDRSLPSAKPLLDRALDREARR